MSKARSKGSVKAEDVFSSLTKINPFSTMDLKNSDVGKIRDYIDTGVWILNAQLSGSIKKGIANNKIYQLAGQSSSGKSFVCLNVCRQAQLAGYSIMYIDTESAIDYDMLNKFKIDMDPESESKFMYVPVSEVSELKTILTTFTKDLKQAKADNKEIPKILVILDSIGMIASDKEVKDAITQNAANDMTRAKSIRSLFRNITSDLGLIGIPMIYTNHVGVNIGGYGDPVSIGGGEGNKYSASVTLCFSVSKIKEDKNDKTRQSGVLVKSKTLKNRFARPEPAEMHINFNGGFNKYIGIHPYINWENVGIAKGNILSEKEYNSLKEADKLECKQFYASNSEIPLWFKPKETALKYVVAHLGEVIDKKELFTARVMEPLIDRFDEVVSKHFAFSDSDNTEDELLENVEFKEIDLTEDDND